MEFNYFEIQLFHFTADALPVPDMYGNLVLFQKHNMSENLPGYFPRLEPQYFEVQLLPVTCIILLFLEI